MSTMATCFARAEATTAASDDHKPILAQRFKTKPCKNFQTSGACPYEHRCMFAHGSAEMRTRAQNLADGLTSEDAIAEFRRVQFAAQKQQQQRPSKPSGRRGTKHGDDNDAKLPAFKNRIVVAIETSSEDDEPVLDLPSTASAQSAALRGADSDDDSHHQLEDMASLRTASEESLLCFEGGYDTSKYVSPLAAAMLSRRPRRA